MKPIQIKTPKGNRKIGSGYPAFIVAEMSANHKQNYKEAEKIIKTAASVNANAIKLQTFTPDTITINSKREEFLIKGKDMPDSWRGRNLYDLYKEAYIPWEWHKGLKKLAENLGLVFFSTPFDGTAVDFLNDLKVPLFKIASYEATDIPLLKKIAKTKKPVIMSVGFASLKEIELSVSTLKQNGTKKLILLHCTTSYNDKPKEGSTNLKTMLDLKKRFNVEVGFSDNMGGIEVPALAAAMGASVIEKHIVTKYNDKSLDNKFSLDKNYFKQMVNKIRWQEKVMGKVNYGCQTEAEKYNTKLRRSLFAVKDIKKGEKFTEENIRDIRPSDGLETKYFEEILGKEATKDIEKGTPLVWSMVDIK